MANIEGTPRICRVCGGVFPLTAEFWNRDRKSFRTFCKKCDSARARKWAVANSERDRVRKRRWYESNRALTIARATKRNTERPDQHRKSSRKWAANNRDEQRQNLKRWRGENPDQAHKLINDWHRKHAAELRAGRQQYRKEHPVQAQNRSQQEWQKRHAKDPEASRQWQRERYLRKTDEYLAAARNRRARKAASPGTHTYEDVLSLWDAQNGKCAACDVELAKSGKDKYRIDHIIPLKPRRGDITGTNDTSNLQLLCSTCNMAKSNLDPRDWAERLGRLLAMPLSSVKGLN